MTLQVLSGFDYDVCPSCGNVQANVNNLGFLYLLREDQRPRHSCAGCGYRADLASRDREPEAVEAARETGS